MSKVKKVRIRKVTEAPAPTSWIYGSTQVLESYKAESYVTDVANMILDQIRNLTGGTVAKSGPGTVTIQIPEDSSDAEMEPHDGTLAGIIKSVTSTAPSFKRIALIGGEQMTIKTAYLGKRHGVVVQLGVEAGQILGVDKDVICEVNLASFANDFVAQDGTVTASMRTLVDEMLLGLGEDRESIAKNIDSIKENAALEAARAEAEARRKVVAEREAEYVDRNWGGW